MTSGAVKVAIHRLWQRSGDSIRQEIAETVDAEAEIAGELRYLIEALRAGGGWRFPMTSLPGAVLRARSESWAAFLVVGPAYQSSFPGRLCRVDALLPTP